MPTRTSPFSYGHHALVTTLVMTGLFVTPLALGSIRHGAERPIHTRIQEDADAGRITLQPGGRDTPPPDRLLIAEIETNHPGARVVGIHRRVVEVEGPQGRDFLSLETLIPNDPRRLQVSPPLPEGPEIAGVVVSDNLGRLLYGDEWDESWDDGRFTGAPLQLRASGGSIEWPLRVVARQRLTGRSLYGSAELVAALDRSATWRDDLEPGVAPPYDEVLVIVPRIARVAEVSDALRRRYPEYRVWTDAGAVSPPSLHNRRLSISYHLALALSTLLLLATLGALSRLDVERRRQVDSRRVRNLETQRVHRVRLAESVLASAVASGIAAGLTALAFSAIRRLPPVTPRSGGIDPILSAMKVHPVPFFQVLGVMLLCSVLVVHVPIRTTKPRPRH